jgi:hypothetical protein
MILSLPSVIYERVRDVVNDSLGKKKKSMCIAWLGREFELNEL